MGKYMIFNLNFREKRRYLDNLIYDLELYGWF